MSEPAAADAFASKPAPSKSARILRRTLVGGLIAGVVGGLLFLAGRSESGAIVLVAGLLLSGLACLEFQGMGSQRGARWSWVLGLCWVISAALGAYALDYGRAARSPDVLTRISFGGYAPVLWQELAVIAMLAVIARAVAAGWGGRRSRFGATLLAAWTAFVCAIFLAPPNPLLSKPQIYSVELGITGFALALLLAALVAWFAHLIWDNENRRNLLVALWVAPLLVLPLPWLWHVWNDFGASGLVAVIVLAKVGDIAGYYIGSAIGVRRPFPRISPGKTLAGCWGSFVVGSLAGGALVAAGLLPSGAWGLWGGLAAGAATNLGAQAGDLLESWIKRRAGVKDSGTWFGPSGGVLDLVDSLLLAVPVALVVWPLVLS